jgi:hypothetical protein
MMDAMKLAVVWVYLYLAYICSHRIDPDYGWHWRTGKYILAHWVPAHDIYSYTAVGFPWVDHEWLNDVVVYWLQHHVGYAAMGLLFAAVWTAALVLPLRGRPLDLAVAGLALGALLAYVGIRPEAWTALGLALVLVIVTAKRPRYWLLVPVFMLWANLHAGFVAGLAVVGLKAVLDRSWRLAAWGLAAVAVTLVNPYGTGLYVELARTLLDGKLAYQIVEWSPLAMSPAVAPLMVAVAVSVLTWKKWDFMRLRAAFLALAAVWSGRHVPLMVVGALGLVEGQIEAAWQAFSGRWVVWARRGSWAVVGGLFPISLLLYPSQVGQSMLAPVPETKALEAKPCAGHLFNDYNYGGWLIWTLPGVPVYIDGRMPSWRRPDGQRYLDVYAQVLEGGAVTDREFSHLGVKCALISKPDDKLSRYFHAHRQWRLEVQGNGAALWRRD